jgi:Domain of unknown function (DUF3859)
VKNILVTLSIMLLTSCSNDKGELLSFGLVNNKTVGVRANDDLLAGEVKLIESWNLVKTTSNIPSEIGTDFGISYRVTAPFYKDSVTIEEVIIFPGKGLTNPDRGRTAKEDTEILHVGVGEEQYFSYAFEYPWEVRSGMWLFQVKQDGNVLLEQTFNVQP